ncbi:MAG: ATP-dependent Clp protease ATP-binding subunit [Candidatus Kerfeldbacteria bacterium]|nr:ATP-dependent Clp protease ATP-binding subunit [Candidatus Kerfeldbacteria bacterium]
MSTSILDKFTTHFRNTLSFAVDFAVELNVSAIEPVHIVYSLLAQKGSIGAEILQKVGLKAEHVREDIVRETVRHATTPEVRKRYRSPHFGPDVKRSIERAALVAKEHTHQYIGTEHLLAGLLHVDNPRFRRLLEDHQVQQETVHRHLLVVLKSTSKFPDLTQLFEKPHDHDDDFGEREKDGSSKTPALDFFTTDLTSDDVQERIDPVIGRAAEIERLIHILSRRTKNNPVLIGEAGVGKTAIVEGLAKRILRGEVPDALIDKRILSLDLSLVVAGTIYRGEFEGRIKQILDEIRADPGIVLFIDELHTIIGAGATSGTMDAANILKPALARGEIRCIGATTLDEYRKHIETDAALDRRFQSIIVEESTPDETRAVLAGIRERYEQYHGVRIRDDALDAAVELSIRYLQDRRLPDKAIDLIDEASSKVRIERKTDAQTKEIRELERELKTIQRQKSDAVIEENFHRAVTFKTQEKIISSKIRQIRDQRSATTQRLQGEIGRQDIAAVVSRMTKIPLRELVTEEKRKLLHLDRELTRRVVGQDEAVRAVASSIRRARTGLREPNRPIASFIFLGPTGVGKTELAKAIADIVFEDPKALIRIDMSEFAEGFNLSKLIGAPAGYVGYKEGAKLTDAVRSKPYAVVLFDEIEKAHPEVFNILLQVLEDGHLTDATGRQVNFKNAIIVMTSNIGLENLNRSAAMGFAAETTEQRERAHVSFETIKDEVLRDLEEHFRPEFLNRLDRIIVFRPLEPRAVEAIVKLQLELLTRRVEQQGIQLTLSPSVIRHIAAVGYRPEHGARAIRRVIQEEIEEQLAALLLEAKHAPQRVHARVRGNKILLDKNRPSR